MTDAHRAEPPSLRDEVANAIAANLSKDRTGLYASDCVLAVVRKRVEALDQHWCVHVGGVLVRRAELLALLGGEPDE